MELFAKIVNSLKTLTIFITRSSRAKDFLCGKRYERG